MAGDPQDPQRVPRLRGAHEPCACCERPRWEKATERMPLCFTCLCVHGAIVGRA